jgi:hypothetical protein
VRRFLVTWRNRSTGRGAPVGMLTANPDQFQFTYLPAAFRTADFRPFVSFPDLSRIYRAPQLFTFFAQRVMDPRRPDYSDYLKALALPLDASPIEVLGRSSGQRKGDSVQVILEPHVSGDGLVDHVLLVSGVRHAPGDSARAIATIDEGARLDLRPEPDNPANPRAILFCTAGGAPVGWVPDPLIDFFEETMHHELRVRVVRVNGPEWPDHLRLVVRASGRASPAFAPFAFAESPMAGLSAPVV